MYAVEKIDYDDLVRKLEKAKDISAYLDEEIFMKLSKPKWQNELFYFWIALAKAARNSDRVYHWFVLQPRFRHLVIEYGSLADWQLSIDRLILPNIGGLDDKPCKEPEEADQSLSKPTKENFQREVNKLDKIIQEQGKKDPGSECTNIQEWVRTLQGSGTGQIDARMLLIELGFNALATTEGILYLIKNYGIQKKN